VAAGCIGLISLVLDDVLDSLLCSITVHRTIPSPNSHRVAIIFDHNCGTLSDSNTQITISDLHEPFPVRRRHPSLAIGGYYDLDVHWVSDKLLDVVLPRNERIYRKDDRAGVVEIRYRSHFVERNWIDSPDQQLREWMKPPVMGRASNDRADNAGKDVKP
jgi:hypothetical protein